MYDCKEKTPSIHFLKVNLKYDVGNKFQFIQFNVVQNIRVMIIRNIFSKAQNNGSQFVKANFNPLS